LELLQDLPERYTVAPWLEKGVKIYHTAYVVRNLDAEIEHLIRARARVVVEPVKAIAFQNRRICFLMLKNLSLIELIDAVG
jgi:methylmalonyl-CoA/ethylmalonyl-CoA epimerase